MAYPVFNPYMNQMQNPYAGMMQMQPQQQFVQPQQFVQQQTGLNGKVVEGFDTFKTADIPMDGSVYYFPKADGTEIYTKRWLQNGTTEQSVYKIVQEQQEEKSNPLMDKLNVIEEQLVSLQESLNKQARTTAKKES
jgi:hypothetical protein